MPTRRKYLKGSLDQFELAPGSSYSLIVVGKQTNRATFGGAFRLDQTNGPGRDALT